MKTRLIPFLAISVSLAILPTSHAAPKARAAETAPATTPAPEKPEPQTSESTSAETNVTPSAENTDVDIKVTGGKVLETSDDKLEEKPAYIPPRLTTSLIASPIDLLIPLKIGAAIGYRPGDGTVLELEYLRGSISVFGDLVDDVGKFTEQRLSLLVRNFSTPKSSFNFFYGVAFVQTKLNIGLSILSNVGTVPVGYDVANFASLGPVIGIGNRWKWDSGFAFTIDWISLSQPVVVIKEDMPIFDSVTNAEDRDDLDTFKKVFSYFPRLVLFKLELGYSF